MASAGAGAPAVAGTSRGWRDSRAARRLFRITDWTSASDLRLALSFGLLALLLRVIWVVSVNRRGVALNDSFFYDLVAQHLASGHGFSFAGGAPTAQWPPVYPFVLSIAFRVFGTHETVGYLMNALVGSASVSLIYLVARRTFGRREAVFAAVALAVLPTQIFLSDVLISETLNVFLIVSVFALLAVFGPTRAAAAVLGVLIGICTLTRGENALLIAVPMVVWWPQLTPRLRAIRLGILLGVVALVLTPWVIRNSQRVHATVLSTNAGQTLYAGHNPHATGTTVIPPLSLIAKQLTEPQPKREVDVNRVLTHYAEHWALRHPFQELLLIPKRFVAFVGQDGDVIPTWIMPDGTRRPTISPVGARRLQLLATTCWAALFAAFIAVLALTGRALWRGRARRPAQPMVRGALTWIGLTTFLYSVVFFGQWRYHVALEPLMLLVIAPAAAAACSARHELAARFVQSGPAGVS